MSSSAIPCAVRLKRAAQAGARGLSREVRQGVLAYLAGMRAEDGGFLGRSSASDLYYTLFALAALDAFDRAEDGASATRYLRGFGEGLDLDLVHLCCLARCLLLVPDARSQAVRVASRFEEFIAPGGGYRVARGAAGSISASFVAQLAYEELGWPLPASTRIDVCVAAGRTADGAWADGEGVASGTTTVTAAATLIQAAAGRRDDAGAGWLMGCWASTGGFRASRSAPISDLLSTAAALLALQALGVPLKPFAEPTLAFIGSLWSHDGGFRGYAPEALSDCEFTYYALVALGALREERP
jgi:hypothetical protein